MSQIRSGSVTGEMVLHLIERCQNNWKHSISIKFYSQYCPITSFMWELFPQKYHQDASSWLMLVANDMERYPQGTLIYLKISSEWGICHNASLAPQRQERGARFLHPH